MAYGERTGEQRAFIRKLRVCKSFHPNNATWLEGFNNKKIQTNPHLSVYYYIKWQPNFVSPSMTSSREETHGGRITSKSTHSI